MPEAMIRARPAISLPFASRTTREGPRFSGPQPPGSENLDAETPRLGHRPPGEIPSAKPHWKAQVVLNPGTPARLAPGRLTLDQQRAQPVRRAVNGRRQALS